LSDSAARRIADLGKNLGQKPSIRPKDVGATSTIGGSAHERRVEPHASSGSSKTTMLAVAVLSAAVAGGSAYYFARGSGAAPSVTASVPFVTASVAVVPAEAKVSTADGPLSVVNGSATLRGRPGETLNVTVEHQGTVKTFAVSLGSDGIASPTRLVLSP
jgi:hypothetical protein